jgi:hypothetical protein
MTLKRIHINLPILLIVPMVSYSAINWGQNNPKNAQEKTFCYKVDSTNDDISYYKYYTYLDNTPPDTSYFIESIGGEVDYTNYELVPVYRDKFKNIKIDTSGFIFISKAKNAISIAKIYLIEKYGLSHVIEDEPYKVILIDDKFWLIEGSLPEGYLGGVPEILISKYDGRVIYCEHGK